MDLLPAGPSRRQMAKEAIRFVHARLGGYPTLVNLEVTHRCNARCDFCRYWKISTENRLNSYEPVIRRLKPSIVVITGGEPLLRGDLEHLVRELRSAFPAIYLGMVTNGAALTPKRARALRDAGLNNLVISLDFPDERHDRARGIPRLARHIQELVPAMVNDGIRNLSIQQVIKTENLDSIRSVIDWAAANRVKTSLSAYTATKNGNESHYVSSGQLAGLRALIDEILRMKPHCNALTSSTWYLSRIPEFFERRTITGCPAGKKFVNVDPAGYVHRCSEFEESRHYTDWKPGCFGPTDCGACWVPCRGESQAPLTWERLKQVAAVYHRPASGQACGEVQTR